MRFALHFALWADRRGRRMPPPSAGKADFGELACRVSVGAENGAPAGAQGQISTCLRNAGRATVGEWRLPENKRRKK